MVDPQPYSWMFETDGKGTITGHRTWEFRDIREYLDDRPATANTFSLRGASPNDGKSHGRMYAQMLQYLGAWTTPDRFTSTQTQFVNPDGSWAGKYSDAATVCACGAVKYYAEARMAGESYDQPHADDCTKLHQHKTTLGIWRQRDRILRQSAQHHQTKTSLESRLMVSVNGITDICRNLGIDYKRLRWQGFRRRRATLLTLRDQFGLSQRDLSMIFGVPRTTLKDHLNGTLRPYQEDAQPVGVVSDD